MYSASFVHSPSFYRVGGDDGVLLSLHNNGSYRWSFHAGGSILNSAAIARDGTIYFGTYNGTFYALRTNGAQLWRKVTPGSYIISSPAIGPDGTIYYGAGDYSVIAGKNLTGSLYALNPLDGSVKWRCIVPSPILSSSPALGQDGMVYIGSFDYKFHAINSTGHEVWYFKTPGYVESSAVLTVWNKHPVIYLTSFKGVYALTHNGTLIWNFNTNDLLSSSPALGSDGTVFITSRDNYLYALNPNGGTLKWKFAASWHIFPTPAVGADNTVYFGASDGIFYAVNGNTGALIWKKTTQPTKFPLEIRSSAAIGSDGGVYVGLLSGYIIGYKQLQPSSFPSSRPSSSPTHPPTIAPTALPSVRPTGQPTGVPSYRPSTSPTCIGGRIVILENTETTTINSPSNSPSIYVTKCGPCTVGTYADTLGASLCTLCPQGYIAPKTGSRKCDACKYPYTNREIHGLILGGNGGNFPLKVDYATYDAVQGFEFRVGEMRTTCDSINMNIDARSLFTLFTAIFAVILFTLGFMLYYPNSGGKRTSKDVIKFIMAVFLVVFPNIELCSYIYCLCTTTMRIEYFTLILIFIGLHSATFLSVALRGGENNDLSEIDIDIPLQPRSTVYTYKGDNQSTSNVPGKKDLFISEMSNNTSEIVRDDRISEMLYGMEGKSDDEIRLSHSSTVRESYSNSLGRETALGEIYPDCIDGGNKNKNNYNTSSINIAIINRTNPVVGTVVSTSTGCRSTESRPISQRSSKSGQSKQSGNSTNSSLFSTAPLLKFTNINAPLLIPLDFTFESIISHVFWLRRDGRYATYGGTRFLFSPKKHNTFLLFSFEVLVWCFAILLQIATIAIMPLLVLVLILFYPLWLTFGAILFLLKLLPIKCVWSRWFKVWNLMQPRFQQNKDEKNLKNNIQNIKRQSISTIYEENPENFNNFNNFKLDFICPKMKKRSIGHHLISASFMAGIFFQSIPLLILNVLNCTWNAEWDPGSVAALYCSAVMVIAGPLCFFEYHYLRYISKKKKMNKLINQQKTENRMSGNLGSESDNRNQDILEISTASDITQHQNDPHNDAPIDEHSTFEIQNFPLNSYSTPHFNKNQPVEMSI